LISYYSYGLLNATTGNEAIHYMVPLGNKTEAAGNVTLF
jgi:hypothetical protein